jgi:signal transduction histidine kinase
VVSDLKVYADKILIQTVLRNLIDNSLKYSAISDKAIEISVIHRYEVIIMQVEDYGQGIPIDKLPFIFKPFYRFDGSRSKKTGGYGLGLHLCKQIMDLHEAKIEVNSKPDGKGIIVCCSSKWLISEIANALGEDPFFNLFFSTFVPRLIKVYENCRYKRAIMPGTIDCSEKSS